MKSFINQTDIRINKEATCIYCGEDFIITDLEEELLKKHRFKNPEHCPTCNFRMLNSYFNDKHLYNRIDSKSGKKIISIYSEEFEGKVIEANDYKKFILDDGGLFFKKEIGDDIFSDFNKIIKSFPKPSRLIYPGLENADYASHIGWSKNIYLSYCVFTDCEDIFFSFRVLGGSKNVFSSYNIVNSSNIYNSSFILNSSNIVFSELINDSSNIIYSKDLQNCSECIFCYNLVNSKYKIFNKQYSKKEYEEIKIDILRKMNNEVEFNNIINKFYKILEDNFISQSLKINKCEKVIGENISDSSNCFNVHIGNGTQNCVNNMASGNSSDDIITNIINSVESGVNCENIIGCSSFGVNVFNLFYSYKIGENSKNIYYSSDIESCEELMFCVGLKNKKYCILNKQYNKEEYFEKKKEIIDKLIKENKWGNPIGFDFGDFPYNDTLAYDYFKINKIINFDKTVTIIDENSKGIITVLEDKFISKAILDLGGEENIDITFRTEDKEINIPENAENIKSSELSNIDEVGEDILDKVIICEETGRPYKIIKQELEFLKKKGFPLPTIHYEVRIEKLVNSRPFGELFKGICDKCNKEILTIYKNKPKFNIFCPECYKNFMYK